MYNIKSNRTGSARQTLQKMDTIYNISQDQHNAFERDGYLLLDDLFSQQEIAIIKTWTLEVHSWPNEKGKWMHYQEVRQEDGQRILCRTENYVNFHEGFHELLRGGRIRHLLGALAGEEMILFKEKINYKNREYIL